MGRPYKASVIEHEPGIDGRAEYPCPARSPGGWNCCLPAGHDRNHIGTTEYWGTLYQWEPESTAALPKRKD